MLVSFGSVGEFFLLNTVFFKSAVDNADRALIAQLMTEYERKQQIAGNNESYAKNGA